MRHAALAMILLALACKQGTTTSAMLSEGDQELPGPEVFENAPAVSCTVDGVALTLTFGPAGDFKWARLSDAPVSDGNPRIDYLQSDSSRIRKNKDGQLVSGRWQKPVAGQDPLVAKVFLDTEPADCQLSGYTLSPR